MPTISYTKLMMHMRTWLISDNCEPGQTKSDHNIAKKSALYEDSVAHDTTNNCSTFILIVIHLTTVSKCILAVWK